MDGDMDVVALCEAIVAYGYEVLYSGDTGSASGIKRGRCRGLSRADRVLWKCYRESLMLLPAR